LLETSTARFHCPMPGRMQAETDVVGTLSELARGDGPLELTADYGFAGSGWNICVQRPSFLEPGEDRLSEIAQEQHVALAQLRPLLMG
jgi:hypothetical protein